MKLLEALVVIAFFLAANVVAAGVVLVLGTLLQLGAPSWRAPLPWIVVGLAGAGAAYLFLKGSIVYAAQASQRLFVARTDPHKGLQSGAGRRGG